jgi:hypothetical protein
METTTRLEATIPFTSREGNFIESGGASNPYILYERFSVSKVFMFKNKLFNATILVGPSKQVKGALDGVE